MNPAAEARAKVKAAHPEAVVVERGRNHIKHRLADAPDGRQRFAADYFIGPIHYLDAEGQWQEIEYGQRPPVWEPEPRLVPVGDRLIPAMAGGAEEVDKQVAASGDDGRRYDHIDEWSVVDEYARLGYQSTPTAYHNLHGFIRWIEVTIEGTIDVAYIECYAHWNGTGTAELKVYGVDEDNPPAPTSAAEFDADPLTDAAVDWDGAWTADTWEESPSLTTIFQELIDTYTISNEAVMVQIKNDDKIGDHRNFVRQWDYEGNLHGPKLHIEYTGAAGEDITVTPPTATLTISTFSPSILLPILTTPGTLSLSLATFAPVLGLSVIPPPLALSLATFVPTVTTTANVTVTPGVCTLSLGLFAPTVTTTANVVVIPGIIALSLTAFAPTVTATGDVTVTPGVLALSLAVFAPVIKLVVIAPTLALNLQTFVPTISTPQLVMPPTASLSLAAFAPTVSAPRLVTPGVVNLSITVFAPTVTVTGNVVITPGTLTLSLGLFAPTIFTPRVVTPGLVALSLTALIPTITVAAAFTAVWFDSGSVVLLLVLDGSVSLPQAVNDGTISIRETEDATV